MNIASCKHESYAPLRSEYDEELTLLRQRDDFSEEFEYFLQVLAAGIDPDEFKSKYTKQLVGLACVQAPFELIDALGFHSFRMRCGSLSMHETATHLPSLACPVIKSCLGHSCAAGSPENSCALTVVPTTCDWTVKLPELLRKAEDKIHIMDLPHLKQNERGRKRWLEEVYELKKVLEQKSGKKLSRRELMNSIGKYADAWDAWGRLVEARRQRKISGVWFLVLANAFLQDDAKSWTEGANAVLSACRQPVATTRPAIFLAGSPISFPNLKIMRLIEDAGMDIVADELCTSERVFVGAPVYDDTSEYGLLKSLSEKYHLACTCPTFADNERRIRNVLATMRDHNITGVVYHVLKGCHPYDIECAGFEKAIKKAGFHFTKIETDFSSEDEKQILVRLEAFKELF